MISKKNINNGIKRLEELKQKVILKYNEEIDYEDKYSIYNVILKHIINGDLNDDFNSQVFDGMNKYEKNDLQQLVSEYIPLCFNNCQVEQWIDSVETGGFSIPLIFIIVLDNYEFLLKIAKEGGRAVLELIKSFRNEEGYNETACVEYLRNTFYINDEVNEKVLINILLNMSKENSEYDIFSNKEKAYLCMFPKLII
ncbi:MAG: hypothetical protein HFJ11_04215 [Bacilli bacterium]|nr:hypothetical protein [Bacilli bacterium]